MMRLPINDTYLSKRKFKRCAFCDKVIDHKKGSATVCGGAIERKPTKQRVWEQIEGFFDIGFHGPPGRFEVFTVLKIADECDLGQFEIYVCSTKCLRRFFSKLVDRLEAKVAKETVATERRRKRFRKSQSGIDVSEQSRKPKLQKRVANKRTMKAK